MNKFFHYLEFITHSKYLQSIHYGLTSHIQLASSGPG